MSAFDVSLGEEHAVVVDDQNLVWTAGKHSCGRLGVMDALCDDAADVIKAEQVEEEECWNGELDGEDEGGIDDVILTASPLVTAAVFSSLSNNDGHNFNEAIRECVADSSLVSTFICIGKILNQGSDEASDGDETSIGGVCAGGAHSFAFEKAKSQLSTSNLLHICENNVHGCRARLVRGRITRHERVCNYARHACPFAVHGCDKIDLNQIELGEHISSCRFRMTDCQHCGAHVSLATYTTHIKTLCMEVEEECVAGCRSRLKRKDLDGHLLVCPSVKEPCPKCKIMIERRMMSKHQEESCSRRLVKCDMCMEPVIFDMIGLHKCKPPVKEEQEEVEEVKFEKPRVAVGQKEGPKTQAVVKRVGGGYAVKLK